MSPFLNEAEDEIEEEYKEPIVEESHSTSSKIKKMFTDDYKFLILGGLVSVTVFLLIGYVMYQSSKPINLEDLPVIKADSDPIKEKPQEKDVVVHQDKIVYDNISGAERKEGVEKIIPAPEEVISIPDAEVEGTLSEEEKNKIIKAFDDLAPEKEYKIDYVKKKPLDKNIIKSGDLLILEDAPRKKKTRLADFAKSFVSRTTSNENVMIQIASLPSKQAADKEYNRIVYKNRFLKRYRKKIIKVDLGREKGIKYRLTIGPFRNNNSAKEAINLLKNNGFNAYILK